MLQQKQIARVLSKALEGNPSPFGLLLLSAKGVPLLSVLKREGQENLKIFLLLVVNQLKLEGTEWLAVELDEQTRAITRKLNVPEELYVAVFYDELLDAVAKVRVDKVAEALEEGLAEFRA